MGRRRITLIVLLTVTMLFTFFSPGSIYADQGDDDLLPSGSINSPVYSSYDKDHYIIDYVPPDNPDLMDRPMINAIETITLLLNLGWQIYMFVVELTIRIVNTVYQPDLIDKLFGLLSSMMPSIVNNLWEDLWFLVAGVGILSVILIWMIGKTNQSLTSLATIVLLVAFVPTTLVYFPTLLSKANTLTTTVGASVMSKMVQTEAKNVQKQMENQQKQRIQEQKRTNHGLEANIAPEKGLNALNSSKENIQKQQINAGIHAIDDSIWTSLVVHPYWIANFGSVEAGRKYWAELLNKGTDEGSRESWIKDKGQIKKNGVTTNTEFIIFTTDGIGERFYKLFVATFLPLIPLVVIIVTAIIVLIWKARAIGRTIFLVFDYLMALYPGYGINTAIQATVRALAAFGMTLFYTIGLGVFLAFWMKIQNPTTFSGVSFGDKILLTIILLFGMWAGIQGVQQRLGNLPGIFGGSTTVNEGQNDLNVMRRMVALQTIQPRRMPKTREPGFISKSKRTAKKWAGQQVLKGARKVATGVGNIDAVRGTGNRLKSFFAPNQAKLTANLSDGSTKAYERMVKKGLEPENLADQSKFLNMHPDQSEPVNDLNTWLKQNKQDQTNENINDIDSSLVPPSPPPKTSPLHHVWKYSPGLQKNWRVYSKARKKVHGERYKEYAQRKQRYDQNLVRRLFTQRPKFVEPSQREYLLEYRQMKERKKAK